MDLNVPQLERLMGLARRDHNGSVSVEPLVIDGLDYIEVATLLTDMGDVPPLHTFLLTPRGTLRSR